MVDVRNLTGGNYVEGARLLLDQVLRILLNAPNSLEIVSVTTGYATVFTVCVADEDMDRLTGEDTRFVQALGSILGAVGLRHHHRFVLEVEEAGRREPEAPAA